MHLQTIIYYMYGKRRIPSLCHRRGEYSEGPLNLLEVLSLLCPVSSYPEVQILNTKKSEIHVMCTAYI